MSKVLAIHLHLLYIVTEYSKTTMFQIQDVYGEYFLRPKFLKFTVILWKISEMKSRKLATQILKMNYPMNSNVRSKHVTCRCILWWLVVDCLSFHGEKKPRETTKKISGEKTTKHNEKRKKTE